MKNLQDPHPPPTSGFSASWSCPFWAPCDPIGKRMARCAHWDWLLQSQCCPHPAGNRPNEGLRTTVHLRCVTKRKVWANQWKDHEEPWTPSLVFTSGKGTVSDTVSSVRTMVFGSDLRRDILGRTWKHVRQTSPRWKLRDTDHRRVLRTTTNVVRVMDIHFSYSWLPDFVNMPTSCSCLVCGFPLNVASQVAWPIAVPTDKELVA